MDNTTIDETILRRQGPPVHSPMEAEAAMAQGDWVVQGDPAAFQPGDAYYMVYASIANPASSDPHHMERLLASGVACYWGDPHPDPESAFAVIQSCQVPPVYRYCAVVAFPWGEGPRPDYHGG